MDWKDYEKEIHAFFASEYPNARITYDAEVMGRLSKVNRQIDVLIEDYIAGSVFRIMIDGKNYAKKIDVKQVDEFIGMMHDVGAHKGILITPHGYTPAAINRAFYDNLDVEVDILNFDELTDYQGQEALPYSGNNGVLLRAPFGWVIDNQPRPGVVATLYQRGIDVLEAQRRCQFMYINFWDKLKDGQSLDDLLKIQEASIKETDPQAAITYPATIRRDDAEVRMRKALIAGYPAPEYTGFVSFKDFIFFCVLLTPEELSKTNLRKLENILSTVVPLDVKQDVTEDDPAQKKIAVRLAEQ